MQDNLFSRTLIADLAALTVAIVVGSVTVLESTLPWNSPVALGSTWPLIILLYSGAVIGSLLARQLWRISISRPSYVRAFVVAATAIAMVSAAVLITRIYWSRPFLLVVLFIWLVVMLGYRAIWRSRPWIDSYVVVTEHKRLADELASSPHADVLRTVQPDTESVDDLTQDGATILVDAGAALSNHMARAVAHARSQGTQIRSFEDVYEEHTGKASIAHADHRWDVPMMIQPKSGYLPLKRLVDIVFVVAVAPFAFAAVMIAVVWVRIESAGAGLFHQERVGMAGTVFTIHKVRTMSNELTTTTPKTADEEGDRITNAGRVLRRLRVDELPQLWNVLKGDLSMVGPRPEQVPLAAEFEAEIPFYTQRHIVRPGITGWAQVHHGYASGTEETIEKLGYDFFYLKHMSIWLDLRILGRSVWAVLTGFGAK